MTWNATSCHSLGIDEACLHIFNKDKINSYEFWAQSEECYKCTPWKYLLIPPDKKHNLKVNTTYMTNILIKSVIEKIEHRYNYHFTQHGIYQLSFNSSVLDPIHTIKKGNNEYISILVAAIFFLLLYLSRLCALSLHSRVNEVRTYLRLLVNRETSQDPIVDQDENLIPPLEGSEIPNLSQDSEVRHIPQIPDTASTNTRLRSLDAFRGFSIVLMIFVNYGGGKYYFFHHARWNGLTVADLVFPWFLWIMGMSLCFSIKSQLRRMTTYRVILFKILKRSVILFILGIILNSLKSNYLPNLRIPGVLQRFAFCYLINAAVEVFKMKPQDSNEYFRFWFLRDIIWAWVQWTSIICLVIIYLTIVFLLPVPGCPRGYLGPGGLHRGGMYGNCTGGAVGYIDQLVFGKNHIYNRPTCRTVYNNPGPFDPEGILGILTSCLTVQLGVAAGRIIVTFSNHSHRIKRWIIWAIVLGLSSGFLCQWSKEKGIIPVNKNLWSVSYVFVTASFAFTLFTIFYYIIDVKKIWSGMPFRVAGLNSIMVYIGHEMTHNLFPWSWTPVKENHTEHLCMNLWATSLWIIIAYACHRKRLYFTI